MLEMRKEEVHLKSGSASKAARLYLITPLNGAANRAALLCGHVSSILRRRPDRASTASLW